MKTISFDFVVIDAGNTCIKIAFFLEHQISNVKVIDVAQIADWEAIACEFSNIECLLCSVLNEEMTNHLLATLQKVKQIDPKTITFKNRYETFETLGADRKANAVFMIESQQFPALSIDIGTCIKFDFVDQNGIYFGGSISPGLNMRFKALHQFTGKLPEVTFEPQISLIGNSTKKAILAGVVLGMETEINGLIQRYVDEYPKITLFITGGDADKIVIRKENCIFAPFLTIEGLYLINKLNA